MIRQTILIYWLAAVTALASSLSLSNPRCEYRTNPIGVDTRQPRLSWEISSTARGVLQSAYQIIVASDLKLSR
jgi:alpha-L-rhamnosidase